MDAIEPKMNSVQKFAYVCSDIGGGIALFAKAYKNVVMASKTPGEKIKNIATYPALVWGRVFRELMREAAENSKNKKSR